MSILDIRSAIGAELEATPEFYDFRVQKAEREGNLWRVTVQPGAVHAEGGYTRVVLDDSFDGASVWWGGPPRGTASVLTVISEEDQVVLKDETAHPPGTDQLVRLYPPRYLQALAECWRDTDWAKRAIACLKDLSTPNPVEANPLSGHTFRWLRRAQRHALRLVQYSSSFLWGPPGTGKTTSLGVILAEYLHVNPRARVLLLSTTNHAVDQATVAVDKALELAKRERLRSAVKRVGTRFIASLYAGREHLLPVLDRDLISRLAKAEGERPPSSDIEAYSAWAEKVERLRRELRDQSLEVLRSARLASMTTTRAAFSLADLRELPVFDLVVFDEASQVGLAHALALMPLGRTRLFAGDPQQLSPVVRSPENYPHRRWLAQSAFEHKPKSGRSVCQLDEQSRMAEPICRVASHLFYRGKLRVAAKEQDDPEWRSVREFAFGPIAASEHVSLQHLPESGSWSQRYQGPIRYESAERIAELLDAACRPGGVAPNRVIVLTPFRAQRALLRQRLSAHGVRHVKVSTVHREQGSEAPVVIFDPVDGANQFLKSEDAHRLINVALSRAQAKIILFLSPGDCANPLFAQISNIVRFASDLRPVTPIADLLEQTGFPQSAVGIRVAIFDYVGEVWMINELSGAEHHFLVPMLRRKALSREF
jgi:DNA replication ATP-dependent helicase Dna2